MTQPMSTHPPQTSGRIRRRTAFGRAVLGAAVMAFGLGAGTAFGAALTDRLGLDGPAAQLLPAALCSVFVVPAILVLRVRRDRRPLAGIGLTDVRTSAMAFGLGVTVTLGSAATVLGAGTAAGWLQWTSPDLSTLLTFVLTNGLIAMLLEALPEELCLRGYAWSSLRERHRAVVTTLVTTALFLAVPGASTVVHAGISAVLGGNPSSIAIVPPGEDPLSYLFLLVVFGLTLITARTATSSASLWTCIGTHLTFLTVNRVALFGEQRGAGWSAELTTPDAVLLVPAYLGVAALAYLTIARLRSRSRGTSSPPAVA